MIERERERERQRDFYENIIQNTYDERERSYRGKVVVHGKEEPWVMTRQALVKYYMWPSRHDDRPVETVLDDWIVFVQDIKAHSGKHHHQGGLVIFILAKNVERRVGAEVAARAIGHGVGAGGERLVDVVGRGDTLASEPAQLARVAPDLLGS